MNTPTHVTLIERNGTEHNFTLPDPKPITSDWLEKFCKQVFIFSPLNDITVPLKQQ